MNGSARKALACSFKRTHALILASLLAIGGFALAQSISNPTWCLVAARAETAARINFPETDLSVTHTAPPSAIAGANVSYLLAVANGGQSFAANPALSVTLPANTAFQAITAPADWNCTPPAVGANGPVSCANEAMDANETANFQIIVKLNANIVCNTAIESVAAISSTSPDLDPSNNSAIASTTVSAQSNLALTLAGTPAAVKAGDSLSYTLDVMNAGPSDSAGTALRNTLPSGFIVETINSSLGSCASAGEAVNCNLGVLRAGESARVTITVHVPGICQKTTAVNTAAVTTANCLADPNAGNNAGVVTTSVLLPNLGPGSCYTTSSPISGTKPGSVLFAGLFASGATGGDTNSNNTRVNLTNVHPNLGVVLHLFFVDGATCAVADNFICLTPNQTTTFLMSDIDPGTVGYMMMLAVDGPPGFAGGTNTGCPISFNYLIGNANIKFTASPMREADLECEAVAAEYGSPLPGCDPTKPFAELPFDGSPNGYGPLPRVIAADNIPSRADGNDTFLMLARVGGNWATGMAPLGNIFGILYDDAEAAHSFSFNPGQCLFRSSLSNTLPRTTPRFEQVIPAGRSGWMKLWAEDGGAIVGAVINRNDNARTAPNAFNGGHNMHVLTLTRNVVITVPVFPPSC